MEINSDTLLACHERAGETSIGVSPASRMVEPMGVEPTASRVRFENIEQSKSSPYTKNQSFQGASRKVFGFIRRVSARVHGQNTDNATRLFWVRLGEALLIAHLMVCSNPMLHKDFSTAVRELSEWES